MIGAIFFIANYFYIKSAYAKPYEMVAMVVEEAKDDATKSLYVLTEEEWSFVSEESVFKNNREPIDWEEIKSFINHCEKPNHSLSILSGDATYGTMKHQNKEAYQVISITCLEYSKETNQHIRSVVVQLFVEKIKDSWKVVGKPKSLN